MDRWLGSTALLFLVTTFGAMGLLESPGLSPALRLTLALLPLAAFAAFIVAEVALIRRLDELARRIQLEALAVAFPGAILLVFGVGFLERAGFSVWGFERLRDMWPLVVLPYGLGLVLAIRRYR